MIVKVYQSLAGSLQYLTFTRPDINYAVQQVCLYMHDPREPHFSALKRILRYVQGTLDYGLQLFSSTTDSLIAYSDADWAGCPTTRRSTLGAEAEYHGVANVVAETCWIRNLLRELHTPLSSATIVYCDNVSAVYLSFNSVQHQCTKHIEIDIYFFWDLVATGQRSGSDSFDYSEIDTKSIKLLISKLEKKVKKQESDEDSDKIKVTSSKIHDMLGVPFGGYSLFDLDERETDHEFVDGLKGQICLDVVRRVREDSVISDIDWCRTRPAIRNWSSYLMKQRQELELKDHVVGLLNLHDE
nr:ribonuclease H-like domain-containing protein [Tanacetum cinerariifolium]